MQIVCCLHALWALAPCSSMVHACKLYGQLFARRSLSFVAFVSCPHVLMQDVRCAQVTGASQARCALLTSLAVHLRLSGSCYDAAQRPACFKLKQKGAPARCAVLLLSTVHLQAAGPSFAGGSIYLTALMLLLDARSTSMPIAAYCVRCRGGAHLSSSFGRLRALFPTCFLLPLNSSDRTRRMLRWTPNRAHSTHKQH